jgi:hypothetical protein
VYDEFRPTRAINCAGKTGRPNIDWCEAKTTGFEMLRSNVIETLLSTELCHEKGVASDQCGDLAASETHSFFFFTCIVLGPPTSHTS